MRWGTLIYGCLFLCMFAFAGCASQYSQATKAELSYTEDGRPVFKLLNNKSYDGLNIDVKKNIDGSYEFHYSADRTDANGAIKAVAESNARLADTLGTVMNLAGTVGGAVVGLPIK